MTERTISLLKRWESKVFLEVLKPFSSEKGFKPPEALERSVNTEGEAAKSIKCTIEGIWLFKPTYPSVRDHCQIFLRTQKNSQTPSHKINRRVRYRKIQGINFLKASQRQNPENSYQKTKSPQEIPLLRASLYVGIRKCYRTFSYVYIIHRKNRFCQGFWKNYLCSIISCKVIPSKYSFVRR